MSQPEEYPAPSFMSETARKKWNDVLALLINEGLFDPFKLPSLEAYCVNYGRFAEAESKILETQQLVVKHTDREASSIDALVKASEKAQKLMAKFAADLGLNEIKRSRTPIPTPDEDLSAGFASYLGQDVKQH
jgi:P27 family predicted phage terminase small subunit